MTYGVILLIGHHKALQAVLTNLQSSVVTGPADCSHATHISLSGIVTYFLNHVSCLPVHLSASPLYFHSISAGALTAYTVGADFILEELSGNCCWWASGCQEKSSESSTGKQQINKSD